MNYLKKIEELSSLDGDENFRIAMDESPGVLWLTEKNNIVYINKSWFEFTGIQFNKEYSRSWISGVHPDDLSKCEEIIPRGFEAGPEYEIEYRLLHHSGVYRWVLEKGKPLFLKDGTFKGFVGVCIDIDNQKKAEAKLLANEEKYRRFFESTRDGILILDFDNGKITDVNPFLIKLLGYSKEEFLGKKLWEVGAFKDTKESKEGFKILQEKGYVRYDNLPLKTKDGNLIEVEFISNAYTVGEEKVLQCNIRDVSERKKAEIVDKALIFLEQEKLKTLFIADATHELRTPLAIIKGNVELALREKNKNTFPVETFKNINEEIDHLAELLSGLTILTRENLDFHQKVANHKINLSELVLRVAEKSKIIATPKNITISPEKMSDVFILGDRIYLEKLFSNIINNAIFYGKEKGNINISMRKNKNKVSFIIKDDGIGISKKDLPFIFERFYRSDNARTTNHEGTGLGLAISKWVVEAHNGTIDVASTYKKGTTFTINLPLLK